MSKTGGLGDNLYLDGHNLSGDVGSVDTVASRQGLLEATGIDKHAHERMVGLRDGALEWSCYFNPEGAHPVISELPSANVAASYWRGTQQGSHVASLVAKQATFGGNRTDNGGFTFSVSCEANGFGIDWGVGLSAGIVDLTGADSGPALDLAAETDHGLQAFWHVFALDGAAVLRVQDSADGSTDWQDVATVAVDDAPAAFRLETARDATVRRYLRWVVDADGALASISFAVAVTKNVREVLFSAT